ncbi:26257_t:CDS:1 [Gigaspora rosea]|nr:26257_t:CDS:1 [Gigaspora rosea]
MFYEEDLIFALIGVEYGKHIELDFQLEIDLQVTDEMDKIYLAILEISTSSERFFNDDVNLLTLKSTQITLSYSKR